MILTFHRSHRKEENQMIYKENRLSFELNDSNLTAEVTKSPDAKGDIFIPRSIRYQSKDYLVISIQKKSFKNNNYIFSIDFPEDSLIRKIGKKAFSYSSLERIKIPDSLEDLEEGWCDETSYLTQISLHPNNKRYKFLNNDKQIIISKSDIDNNEYDTLIFACRNIKKVFIPSTIKHISSSAFQHCQIRIIEYDDNSQLETIGKKVFGYTKIKNIFIPAKLKHVDTDWLSEIWQNIDISISPENKVFKYIDNKMIVAKSNPDGDEFDILVFAHHSVTSVTIPSSIKTINSNSFFHCNGLNSIEFSEDSELTIINECAFCWTGIKSITIPATVKFIGKEAFSEIRSLKTVIFPQNSQLRVISRRAFGNSKIESITIPSKVELFESVFHFVDTLNKIEISKENKNFKFLDNEEKVVIGKSDPASNNYDVILLACRDIKEVFIPSSITKISPHAFSQCQRLQKVEFSENSQLETIGKHAFSNCPIEVIKLPSSVKCLDSYCFSQCNQLKSIEISEDSELLSIGLWAFHNTLIENIFIPPKLQSLEDRWFDGLAMLKSIEISPKNDHFGFIDQEHKIFGGKSDINNESYDILHFVLNGIEKVEIPSFVKQIKTYSFFWCKQLKNVTFSQDSQLEVIENDSFCGTWIEEISIPSKVKYIGQNIFGTCYILRKIEFSENSELTYFSKEMFDSSSVEKISIPSKIKELKNGWCSFTPSLNEIELSSENKCFSYLDNEKKIIVGKSNEKNDFYDILVFVCRDVKKVTIPSTIKYISSFCFYMCQIDHIKIPKSVTHIEDNAFCGCSILKTIDFECGSDEIVVDDCAFRSSLIENIVFPSKSSQINLLAFSCCDNLSSIEFLGEEVFVSGFFDISSVVVLALPNAKTFYCGKNFYSFSSSNFLFFINHDANII